MRKLIINADDYGYSSGVNYGIIHAHQRGILTSTTIMANMPGFDEAVSLAKENPKLGIGVHLTLTCGSPVRDDVNSLTTNNSFHNLKFYENDFTIDDDELYLEWKSQIDKVFDAGIKPTHLDSHHHINSISKISDVFIKLAKEYQLPVRNNFNLPNGIKSTKYFFTTFDSFGFNKEIWKHMDINNLVNAVINFETVEVMCHPAYVDAFLLENSTFNVKRTVALKELTDPKYKSIFLENNIELTNYNDIN